MATRFTAQTDMYAVASGAIPGNNEPSTLIAWVKLVGTWAGYRTAWAAHGGGYVQVATDVGGSVPTVYTSNSSDIASGEAYSPGTWYRVAVLLDPSGGGFGGRLMVGEGAGGTLSVVDVASGAPATAATDTLYLGGSSFAGEWLDGSLAGVKMYSTLLSEAEIEAEWASWDAVRTADLVRHYRLQTPESTDHSGNGYALTTGSTSPSYDSDDPPIGSSTEGALAGALAVLPAPGGQLAAQVTTQGVLSGSLAALSAPGGQLAGTLTSPGALAGALPVLPALGGQVAGALGSDGAFAGPLPVLPALGGQVAGGATSSGALAGTLPELGVPAGALAGAVGSDGAAAGALPGLPGLAGQLVGAAPPLGGELSGALAALAPLAGALVTHAPAPGRWTGGPPTRPGRWSGLAMGA